MVTFQTYRFQKSGLKEYTFRKKKAIEMVWKNMEVVWKNIPLKPFRDSISCAAGVDVAEFLEAQFFLLDRVQISFHSIAKRLSLTNYIFLKSIVKDKLQGK